MKSVANKIGPGKIYAADFFFLYFPCVLVIYAGELPA